MVEDPTYLLILIDETFILYKTLGRKIHLLVSIQRNINHAVQLQNIRFRPKNSIFRIRLVPHVRANFCYRFQYNYSVGDHS
jgi:hypothetical protein